MHIFVELSACGRVKGSLVVGQEFLFSNCSSSIPTGPFWQDRLSLSASTWEVTDRPHPPLLPLLPQPQVSLHVCSLDRNEWVMVILTAPCTPHDISPHWAGKCVCIIQTRSEGIFRADIGESRAVGHVCRERQDRLSLVEVVLGWSEAKRTGIRALTRVACTVWVTRLTEVGVGWFSTSDCKSFGMPPCPHQHPRHYTATFIRELIHVMLSRRFIRQPAPVWQEKEKAPSHGSEILCTTANLTV